MRYNKQKNSEMPPEKPLESGVTGRSMAEEVSMIEQATRTVGFFCPYCRNACIMERSAFTLAAGRNALDCPCGKSRIEVEMLGEKIRLKMPCLLCEESHSFTCSTNAFLHETIVAFSCGASGLDCCYIGEEGAVFAAMKRLEETIDALEAEAAGEGAFLNRIVMEEILEELRDIGARGGVSCGCGSKEFSINIQFSAVELHCNNCGNMLKIPAGTLQDVEDLCCKPKLLIPGKER